MVGVVDAATVVTEVAVAVLVIVDLVWVVGSRAVVAEVTVVVLVKVDLINVVDVGAVVVLVADSVAIRIALRIVETDDTRSAIPTRCRTPRGQVARQSVF